jgi:hypothetical protein
MLNTHQQQEVKGWSTQRGGNKNLRAWKRMLAPPLIPSYFAPLPPTPTNCNPIFDIQNALHNLHTRSIAYYSPLSVCCIIITISLNNVGISDEFNYWYHHQFNILLYWHTLHIIMSASCNKYTAQLTSNCISYKHYNKHTVSEPTPVLGW